MKVCLLIGFQYEINSDEISRHYNNLSFTLSDDISKSNRSNAELNKKNKECVHEITPKICVKNTNPANDDKKHIFNELGVDGKKLFLPGIIIDLYQAYKFCLAMCPDRILVITDIIEDPPTRIIKDAIINEVVDGNILNFIADIKTRGHYICYTNLQSMIKTIQETIHLSTDTLIYYTGHSKSNHLILPNDAIAVNNLRIIILKSVIATANIYLLFDCCYGVSFDLPFHLVDNRYTLTISDQQGNNNFTTQRIISISSASENENSGLTIIGSIFTRIIFKLLHNKFRNINRLIAEINRQSRLLFSQSSNFAQTASAYSSHPDAYFLSSWLFNNKENKISFDPIKNIMIITMPSDYKICT